MSENTLTGLIPTIYAGLVQGSRELIGFIPNVNLDVEASGAGINQVIRSPVAPQAQLEDIVAGQLPANTGAQTISYTDIALTNAKVAPIQWTGEEELKVSKGTGVDPIRAMQFSEAFRALSNAVEASLASTYKEMALATGAAGTTPFGTADDMTDFAEANRILDLQGASQQDRIMIVGSAARSKLEGIQSGLFKVNEAGTSALLRDRSQNTLYGFTMGYSAGIQKHVKGTGTGYLVNSASLTAGSTTIPVDGGTAGATGIKAGDVITFAGDSEKYVVKTGLTTAAGNIELTAGLKSDIADNAAITIGNSYTGNMFYQRNAITLVARPPAMPQGGDMATDVMNVTDPVSGITFQIAEYKSYRQRKIEVGLVWGVGAPNGKHGGVLLG